MKYLLILLSLITLFTIDSYSQAAEYVNNKLLEYSFDSLPPEIDAVQFKSCNWNFIKTELKQLSKSYKTIQSFYFISVDTVDIDTLTNIYPNLESLSISWTPIIISKSNSYPNIGEFSLEVEKFDFDKNSSLFYKFPNLGAFRFSTESSISDFELDTLINKLSICSIEIKYLTLIFNNKCTIPQSINNFKYLSELTIIGSGQILNLNILANNNELKKICIKGFDTIDIDLLVKLINKLEKLENIVLDNSILNLLVNNIDYQNISKKRKIKFGC